MKSQLAAILAGCLLFSAPLLAQDAPPPPTDPQRPAEAIKRILDLSDQQAQQLADLRSAHLQQMRELGGQVRELGQQRRELLSSDNPDPAAIGSLLIQEQGLRKQMQGAQQSYREAALNLLTADQKEKVAQIQRAVRLATQAGPLAAFGLIQGPGPGRGPRPGMFHGPMPTPMEAGPGMMIMRWRRGEPQSQ